MPDRVCRVRIQEEAARRAELRPFHQAFVLGRKKLISGNGCDEQKKVDKEQCSETSDSADESLLRFSSNGINYLHV